jgi:hypothetical protein
MMVKHVIDPKGLLKGKGGALAQWRKEAEDRLAAFYRQMDDLAQQTRAVEGRRFGLMVYKLRDARQLRWRFTSVSEGTVGRHATWERIETLLPEFSPVLAQWYRDMHDLALVLNHQEQVARYEIKTIDRLMAGRQMVELKSYRGYLGRDFCGGRRN